MFAKSWMYFCQQLSNWAFHYEFAGVTDKPKVNKVPSLSNENGTNPEITSQKTKASGDSSEEIESSNEGIEEMVRFNCSFNTFLLFRSLFLRKTKWFCKKFQDDSSVSRSKKAKLVKTENSKSLNKSESLSQTITGTKVRLHLFLRNFWSVYNF